MISWGGPPRGPPSCPLSPPFHKIEHTGAHHVQVNQVNVPCAQGVWGVAGRGGPNGQPSARCSHSRQRSWRRWRRSGGRAAAAGGRVRRHPVEAEAGAERAGARRPRRVRVVRPVRVVAVVEGGRERALVAGHPHEGEQRGVARGGRPPRPGLVHRPRDGHQVPGPQRLPGGVAGGDRAGDGDREAGVGLPQVAGHPVGEGDAHQADVGGERGVHPLRQGDVVVGHHHHHRRRRHWDRPRRLHPPPPAYGPPLLVHADREAGQRGEHAQGWAWGAPPRAARGLLGREHKVPPADALQVRRRRGGRRVADDEDGGGVVGGGGGGGRRAAAALPRVDGGRGGDHPLGAQLVLAGVHGMHTFAASRRALRPLGSWRNALRGVVQREKGHPQALGCSKAGERRRVYSSITCCKRGPSVLEGPFLVPLSS